MKTEFTFGRTTVRILQGDILSPGVPVDAVASTDDNYLTMASGVSGVLRQAAGAEDYVRLAQANTPVKAGSVVVTDAYGLKEKIGARCVLHGAVIDYDSDDTGLAELVEATTLACLREAEARGCPRLLLPAFATGAGRLDMGACGRQMGRGIKAYLAQERRLTDVVIILYLPQDDMARFRELNRAYISAINLILGSPYDPRDGLRQARDFYGLNDAVAALKAVLAGSCDQGGKCHAVILGGSMMGKRTLLDHLYHAQFEAGSTITQGRRLVRLSFGNIHPDTSRSFIYRKLLSAMLEEERASEAADEAFVREIRALYSNTDITSDEFLAFLDAHADRYPEVVFLIDKLPALLGLEAEQDRGRSGARQFWADLDQLQTRVRFIYTARDDAEYQQLRTERLATMTTTFKDRVLEVRVRCLTDDERRIWLEGVFARYLDGEEGAPELVQRFVADEAGRHPYLISLVIAELATRVKIWQLENPGLDAVERDEGGWSVTFQQVREAIAPARAGFYPKLFAEAATHPRREELLWELERLAEATHDEKIGKVIENQTARKSLHAGPDSPLEWLEHHGLVVDSASAKAARFVSPGLGDYIYRRLHAGAGDRPGDVTVSLICPKPDVIRTVFQARSALVPMADNAFTKQAKAKFMKNYLALIDHRFRGGELGDFADIRAVSQYILTQFTDDAIKEYLRSVPERSTFSLLIDESYKEIPWELMLEAVYEGEIPFQVGRTIVGRQVSRTSPPVRSGRKVKALIIGNPTGDLPEAEKEAAEIAGLLGSYPQIFEPATVLLGKKDGRSLHITGALSQGYDLIHYSGHTEYAGSQSAWRVADDRIKTDSLTKALKGPKALPPALVFSSSCESAASAAAKPLKYQAQAFDLPGAFLNAGVEAYVGSLWPVEETAARRFAVDFYNHFILSARSEPITIGECLRRARWQRKQEETPEGRINWLAFVLYGDPHLTPGELLPAMQPTKD